MGLGPAVRLTNSYFTMPAGSLWCSGPGLTLPTPSVRIPVLQPVLIALLTDFGLTDAYAGILRGVIAGIAPQVQVVDLTHQLPPGDVRRASFTLWQASPFFPAGTIFLCVVDPEVGTGRRGVALAWEDRMYVGPDNGAATYLVMRDRAPSAYELTAGEYRLDPVSSTFHGRDIFAPAAAHLASDLDPARLGPAIQDLVLLTLPNLGHTGRTVRGEILHADHFGNCVTSIGRLLQQGHSLALEPWLRQAPALSLPTEGLQVLLPGGVSLPLLARFADAPRGEAVAYVGSSGLLEIGVNHGSAQEKLALSEGQPVRLENRG